MNENWEEDFLERHLDVDDMCDPDVALEWQAEKESNTEWDGDYDE